VAIGDIDNSTQQGAVGYNNYLHLSTDVERGQSYDITVERNSGGSKPMNRRVWVDWNIDGDFDDAGELVASEASGTSATFTASIKVPGDAVAGSTRLRVSANYKDLKNLACGPHQFGEFEDYTLEIGEKDLTAPVLTLLGKLVDSVAVGGTWTEPGYTAEDLVDGDITASVKVGTSFDANVVGAYDMNYTVSDAEGNTATARRTVHVVDLVAPTIALNGADTVTIEVNTAYDEQGAVAADNYYTGLTVEVVGNVDTSSIGTYTVSYCVTDGSGNGPVCAQRVVVVEDTQAPVIALNGNANETVEVFHAYTEAGYTASDNGDYAVTVSGTWTGSTDVVGSYTLTYTATDMGGNTASVTRDIEVVDTEAPAIALVGSALVQVGRWADYTDAGYTVSDNYYSGPGITVATVDEVNTQSEGTYLVSYTATDGSGNVSATVERWVQVIENLDGLGLGEGTANGLSVYPNPSTGMVFVSLGSQAKGPVDIKVTDAAGKVLVQTRVAAGESTTAMLNLTHLQSGVYFLEVSGTGTNEVKAVNIVR
jgi:hypothetical protein